MKVKIYLALMLLVSVKSLANQTPVVTQTQLLKLQHAPSAMPFILLDVRSQNEYNAGHIAGAINIAHDELANKLPQLSATKDTAIIVYCRSGRRASIAETILRSNDYYNVRHLQGDMNLWQAQQQPIQR